MKNNKRRNNRVSNMLAIVIMLVCFAVVPGFAGYVDTHYTMTCEVDSVKGEVVTVLDKTGNLWNFYGDGFRKGDRVKVTFFTNTTDNTRYDDEIIKVEKK